MNKVGVSRLLNSYIITFSHCYCFFKSAPFLMIQKVALTAIYLPSAMGYDSENKSKSTSKVIVSEGYASILFLPTQSETLAGFSTFDGS